MISVGPAKTTLRSGLALPAAALLVSAWGFQAQAGGVVFTYNDHTGLNKLYTHSPGASGPPADDSADVQTYMDSVLIGPGGHAGWSVTVKGAAASGSSGTSSTTAGYNGDGHVVCASGNAKCTTSGTGSYSDTLSTLDKSPFIMTSGSYTAANAITDAGVSASVGANLYNILHPLAVENPSASTIKMAFTGSPTAVQVTSLSFDFEIFPDGSCTTSGCGASNFPDFTFVMTTGSGNGTSIIADEKVTAPAIGGAAVSASGANPYGPGTFSYTCTNTQGSYSPNSGTSKETAPQCIGSMTFNFAGTIESNPTLYFVDWPDAIGITNIDWGTPGVPEPASLILFGSGLIGLGILRRRRKG